MRADLFSCTFSTGRLAGLALVVLAAAGCKTEKDPDDPTLLGAPPTIAYIGVEYYYNWGAYGGDGILDYSLTNAPTWLALENTSNKARQGVIMRGVPGLTGGERGLADLGKTEDIDIVTTDGRMAGFQPFNIEVKHNLVTVEAPEFTEGESPDISAPRGEHCALPDLESEGAHSISDEDAQPTRRVYAKVKLERPSVTRVSIAFQLESDFACDEPVGSITQDCHSEDSNMGRAIVGRDIVALGSDSALPVDKDGNELTYVTYQEGFFDRGVVTLEPGITECYIPLEVIDDKVAEPTEQARLALTEVREGLASLGNNNAGISTNLTIADNEPVVALRTLNGGTRDTLNVDPDATDLDAAVYNENQIYTAILTGEREGQVNVKLTVSERGSTVGEGDFLIIQDPAELEGAELDPMPDTNELVFLPGKNEVLFSVTAKDYADTEDNLDDRLAILVVDERAQAGQPGFARGESDELMTLSFNRLLTPLVWTDGFEPTDMAVGGQGELYVAGRLPVSDGFQLQIRAYDQEGTQLGTTVEITDVAAPVPETNLYLALGQRTERNNGARITYEEMVVAYSASDVAMALYRKNKETGAYEPVPDNYTLTTGSSGNDVVKWVGYQGDNGNLIVAGESAGAWPGQSSSGGTDTFLAVIETTGLELKLKEVRQVGSGGNDRVAGATTDSGSPMVFGYAPQVVDGNGAVGPFFYSGTAAGAVYGGGVEATEQLRHGLYAHGTAWMIGDGPWSYSVKPVEEGANELERVSGSQTGFLLGFSSTGTPTAAFTISDENGNPTQTLSKGLAFDKDVVVAGKVDANQGILARVTTEEGDLPYRNWREQLVLDGIEFLALRNYRDDEIIALVTRQDSGPQILLFSPEGKLLTPIN